MADQLTPTRAARSEVLSDAGPLAALVGSAPTVGASLLLLPGYTGSKEDFAPLLDPLARAGICGVAVDQPGQFETPGPKNEAGYSPAALGAVAASVVRGMAADGPVVLLGHSYGGLVARAAVLAGAPVAGLVLLCTGPAGFTSGERLDALNAGDAVLRELGRDAAYGLTQPAGAPDSPLDAFLRRRMLATSETCLLGMNRWLRTEPDLVDELGAALAVVLADRRRRVAVIAGESDDAWPLSDQRGMARRLGTELVLIPGAAHSPAVENPAALLAVLIPLIHCWTAPS